MTGKGIAESNQKLKNLFHLRILSSQKGGFILNSIQKQA